MGFDATGGHDSQPGSHAGKPLSETQVNRRLAAILAADVVGYSRMIGEDEAGTLAALEGSGAICSTRPWRAIAAAS